MVITGNINQKMRKALCFYADRLISPQLNRHIFIDIKWRKYSDNEHGFVSVLDYNSKNKPRSFLIEINRSDKKSEQLKTLAHELVHVKQYCYGELNEAMTFWRGEKIDSDRIVYFEQPWEVEAETTAINLYQQFLESQTNE
jgi:hypothetical protein